MWDGKVPSARRTLLWQCCLPPLHRTQRWATLRFGLGGKGPGAEILRWESPARPETPLPLDVGSAADRFRPSAVEARTRADSPKFLVRLRARNGEIVSPRCCGHAPPKEN